MLNVTEISKRFALNKKEKAKQKGKSYFQAIENLSFSAPSGAVTALLGVNGAGKTTTLRILTSAIKSDSGSVEFESQSLFNNRDAISQLGYLSGSTELYRKLTVKENLVFFAKLFNVPAQKIESRITELSALLEMDNYIDKKVQDLSTGMKQKANIARAVIHDPNLIIFDEPTTGLDVLASIVVENFIKTARQQGKTILFSTHNMHEVTELADCIVVIHNGRVVFQGNQQELSKINDEGSVVGGFMYLINQGKGER